MKVKTKFYSIGTADRVSSSIISKTEYTKGGKRVHKGTITLNYCKYNIMNNQNERFYLLPKLCTVSLETVEKRTFRTPCTANQLNIHPYSKQFGGKDEQSVS